MDTIKMKAYLMSKGILGPSGHKHFKSMEKLSLDKDALDAWSSFKLNYRTEDEAWCCVINNLTPPKCPICRQLCKFNGAKKLNFYNTTCGVCSANAVPAKLKKFSDSINKRTSEERQSIKEKRRATNLEKYGDANYGLFGSNSFKNNLKEKYGNAHYNNREKAKQTCLKKYGVSSNLALVKSHAPDYEKVKKTNLERYGVEHISQVKQFQEKAIQSKVQHREKLAEENNATCIKDLTALYGTGWYCAKIVPIFHIGQYSFVKNADVYKIKEYFEQGRTHTNNYVSKKEKDLLEYVRSIYKGTIVENDTSTVSNNNHRYFELDIFLPDENIALDFDGNYYHSTKFKDKSYHQRKTLCSYRAGVKLAHVLERDWDENKDIVKENIKELILNHKSFNDGFFPTFQDNVVLSNPRKHIIGDFEYYDTGVIC